MLWECLELIKAGLRALALSRALSGLDLLGQLTLAQHFQADPRSMTKSLLWSNLTP